MQPDWQRFLREKQAHIVDSVVTGFQASEVEDNYLNINILCDLSHYGLIRVTGSNAAGFLQGQFSNDLTQVSDYRSQLSSYSTPKGRMLAVFRIFKRNRDDSYFLQLPAELIEPVTKRLQMFIMRADVTLHNASSDLIRIGFSGPHAGQALSSVTHSVPEFPNDCIQHDALTIISVPGENPRYEIIATIETIKTVWNQLEAFATPVGASIWSLLDIQSGIPTVYTETSEAFVPQMANLELVGGVNFKKGCYPGQEIIARMHYLGTLKRRMYLLHSELETPPPPGTAVYASSDKPEQPSGTIVDAQSNPRGGTIALAVVKIEQATTSTLHHAAPNGPQYTITALPYELSSTN